MQGYLFIINPIAGQRKIKKVRKRIINRMELENVRYDIIETKKPIDATEIVKDNIEKYEVFIAAGGDGTIREVVSGLAECRKGKLGILPIGTANDLAKAMNLGNSIEENISRILNGEINYIDLGQANGDSFLNIGSLGFDSEVIVNYNNFKRDRGKLNYYLSAAYSLIKYKNIPAKIIIDGKEMDKEVFILAIGNGKYYGGGFKVLPESKFDDGYYHICVVEDISKLAVLFLFPTLITGDHVEIDRYVKIYKGKSIEVISEEKMNLNLDGEILGRFNQVKFTLPGYKIPVIY